VAVLTLSGAARKSVVRWLEDDSNMFGPEWDQKHDRWIADWYVDEKNHRVCGCELHQAFCAICYAGWDRDDY
jgi:hypothetical protein